MGNLITARYNELSSNWNLQIDKNGTTENTACSLRIHAFILKAQIYILPINYSSSTTLMIDLVMRYATKNGPVRLKNDYQQFN